MGWIEGIYNHFECEGIIEAQKVAKKRTKRRRPNMVEQIQEERKKLGKEPIINWKAMVNKMKEQYFPEDYEIQLHKKRQSLKKKDMDIATYIEEFQNLCPRSRVQEYEAMKVAKYLINLKWSI